MSLEISYAKAKIYSLYFNTIPTASSNLFSLRETDDDQLLVIRDLKQNYLSSQ